MGRHVNLQDHQTENVLPTLSLRTPSNTSLLSHMKRGWHPVALATGDGPVSFRVGDVSFYVQDRPIDRG